MLLLGTNIDVNKAASKALLQVFGINSTTALKICAKIGMNPNTKLSTLNPLQLEELSKTCSKTIDYHQKYKARNNIKALINIKHYRGTRHMLGLPSRGQRSKTNASTCRKRARRY